MVLSAKRLCERIRIGNRPDLIGISIVPEPDLHAIERAGEVSITLRLGRWFTTLKQSHEKSLELDPKESQPESKISKSYFVPFGKDYILHPGRFVLGCTLEWVRLPSDAAAFVVGKSKLGRRGIIIETASGVHPGFCGCITLEIANVGEIPVNLIAGMPICQLFFHDISGEVGLAKTSLSGQRKPRVGQLQNDPILERLRKTR